MTKRTLALAPLAILALGLAACAPAAAPAATGAAAPPAVAVQGLAFKPPTLEVAVGATVRWTNQDPTDHTVTAGTPEGPEATFDLPLDRGANATFTFQKTGTFAYFCSIHGARMSGRIVVK